MRSDTPTYDIKSASLSLVAFLLKTTDLSALEADLARRLGTTPGFFDNDPVVIDLSSLDESHPAFDFGALCALLRTHRMQ